MYSKTTNHIKITVEPIFLEDESSPLENHYVWAYRINIENQGDKTVQLIERKWLITDGMGVVHEVSGQGVVGEQPVISPGETYQYTSGAPLSTPSGMMEGTYTMKTKEGDVFEVEIPLFSLDSHYETATVH